MSCRVGVPRRHLGGGGQVALVVDQDRERRPELAPQQRADRDVVPAEVGSVGEQVAGLVVEAGDADRHAGDGRSAPVDPRDGRPDEVREAHEHALGVHGARVERHAALLEHVAAHVHRHRRDVVDVDLGADADHGAAVQLHGDAGTPDPALHDLSVGDQAALHQLADEGRHRRAGHPQLRGQRRAGPRTVVAQVAQGQAEVGATDVGMGDAVVRHGSLLSAGVGQGGQVGQTGRDVRRGCRRRQCGSAIRCEAGAERKRGCDADHVCWGDAQTKAGAARCASTASIFPIGNRNRFLQCGARWHCRARRSPTWTARSCAIHRAAASDYRPAAESARPVSASNRWARSRSTATDRRSPGVPVTAGRALTLSISVPTLTSTTVRSPSGSRP